jgi:hypothetical protein
MSVRPAAVPSCLSARPGIFPLSHSGLFPEEFANPVIELEMDLFRMGVGRGYLISDGCAASGKKHRFFPHAGCFAS